MGFASPWLLAGLLLVAAPVLIHLWQRRRIQQAQLPTLALLRVARRKVSRRTRLRDLLLLLLRILAVAVIPLALARPYLAQELGPEVPQAVAVVLDASFSMQHGDSFARAKEEADALLSSLRPQDTALLLLADEGMGRRERPAPSYEVAPLRAALEAAQPSAGAGSLDEALRIAEQALRAAPQPLRRVVVFTDGTRAAFAGAPAPTWPAGGPRLEIVDVAPPDLPNRAVVGVTVEAAPEVGAKSFRVSARVGNFSGARVEELPIWIELDGQVASRGFLTLKPGEIATKTFHLTPAQGGQRPGRVVIEADALPLDDERAFVLAAPRELRALLVNGDPRAVRFEDEAYFVEEALSSAPSAARVRTVVVTPEGLDEQDLSSFDVVALLNVGALSDETLRELRGFVEAGGGLLVSGGDQTARALRSLDPVLPVKLRDVFVASDGAFSGGGTPRHFAPAKAGHPVFQDFDPNAPGGLSQARFGTILLFEPSARDDKQTLLAFDDGAPALLESPLGQGKVLVFASTLDRGWSDLPVRPGYVPLIQGIFRYLGNGADGPSDGESLVGAERVLPLPAGWKAGRATLTGPGEAVREILPGAFRGNSVRLTGLSAPGLWRLTMKEQELPPRLLAVGLTPAESSLDKLSPETLSAASSTSGTGLREGAASGDLTPGRPLAPYVLLLLLGALLAESFYSWFVRHAPVGRFF